MKAAADFSTSVSIKCSPNLGSSWHGIAGRERRRFAYRFEGTQKTVAENAQEKQRRDLMRLHKQQSEEAPPRRAPRRAATATYSREERKVRVDVFREANQRPKQETSIVPSRVSALKKVARQHRVGSDLRLKSENTDEEEKRGSRHVEKHLTFLSLQMLRTKQNTRSTATAQPITSPITSPDIALARALSLAVSLP